MIFHHQQEIAYGMKPLAVKAIQKISMVTKEIVAKVKRTIVVIMAFVLALHVELLAQRMQIDTIRQPIVLLHCTTIPVDDYQDYIDISQKDFIWFIDNEVCIGTKNYLNAIIENNVNGLLIYNEDLSMLHWHAIKMLGLNFRQLIKKLPDLGYLGDSPKALPVPYTESYKRFSAYRMETQWIRYTFCNSSKTKTNWKTRYLSQVPKADGKNYCYYVLDKVFSKTCIE
jgi:hypothetical protein